MNSKETVHLGEGSVQHTSAHRAKNTKNIAFHLQRQRALHADAGDLAICGVGPRPFACWEFVFDSNRGHRVLCDVRCDGLIIRPDESYRVCCVGA